MLLLHIGGARGSLSCEIMKAWLKNEKPWKIKRIYVCLYDN